MAQERIGAMTRRKWLFAAAVFVVVLTAIVWLPWPGSTSPLAVLLRQDQTWQNIHARGAFRVGMDPSFPPFEYLDDKGLPAGFDVELAQKLAAEWGVKAEIVAIGFDSLVDALKAAKVDAVVSAYPYDPRLTRDVAFSAPYFDAGLRLVIRQGSTIAGTGDLAGKRVAVEWGSTGDMTGRQLQRDGIALELSPFETPQAAVQALIERADIDALLIDNVTLRQAQGRGAKIAGVGEPLESNPYTIVTPIRALELRNAIDTSLLKLEQSNTMATLEAKWFSQTPMIELTPLAQ